MAIQEAKYICDKCGQSTTYLPMVFEPNAFRRKGLYEKRLCDVCFNMFLQVYNKWCGTPEIKDPEPLPIKTYSFTDWLPKRFRRIKR